MMRYMNFYKSFFLFLFLSLLNINSFAIDKVDFKESFSKEFNKKDALFLRRMIEFWEEGQKDIVVEEINNYLKEATSSPFLEYLYALLGDIYITEKKFSKALDNYFKVSKKEIKEEISLNFLQCLHHEKKYAEIKTFYNENESYINLLARDKNERCRYILADSLLALSEKMKLSLKEKNSYLLNAKEIFLSLLNTNYESYSLESLAWVEKQLGQYEEAAKRFIELSKRYGEKREVYLFQAGVMQANYNKRLALDTFTEITHIGKKKVKKSVYNRLLLLMDLFQFEEIIELKEYFLSSLSKKHVDFYYYVLGYIYFQKKDYEKALFPLLKSIEKKDKKQYVENAHIMLADIAQEMNDIALSSKIIESFDKTFNAEKKDLLAKFYFGRAMIFQKRKDFVEAEADYNYITENFKFFNEEDFLEEAAFLYYNNGNYLKSRAQFKTLINKVKEGENLSSYWRYFISSSIKALEKAEEKNKKLLKNILIKDLDEFLNERDILSEKEYIKYSLFLASSKYETNDYTGAIDIVFNLANDHKEILQNPNALLLIAECNKNLKKIDLYIEFAKKALFFDREKKLDHINLHLSLYNTNLNLSKDNSKHLKDAADHLYLAYLEDYSKIKEENFCWLCNYLYNEAKNYIEKKKRGSFSYIAKNRCIKILENHLSKSTQNYLISKDKKFLENSMYMLAKLYGLGNEHIKKINMLKEIVKNYSNKEIKFSLKGKVFFALADTFLEVDSFENAKRYFSYLASGENFSKVMQQKAKQKLLRLNLLNINPSILSLKDQNVVDSLVFLKNLKLQKNVNSEPMHLEAALDYIDLLYHIDMDMNKKYDLLMKAREDLINSNDLISKVYFEKLKKSSKKEKIYHSFLMYLEAEIYLTKSMLTNDEKDVIKAYDLMKIADKYYANIPYLKAKVDKSMNILDIKLKQVCSR